MGSTHSFTAELWDYQGKGAWHFLTVPEAIADDIEAETVGRTGGFGSVRVEVTVGATVWSTSLFPDSKLGSYVLPVKKAVRQAEALVAGSPVDVTVRVLI